MIAGMIDVEKARYEVIWEAWDALTDGQRRAVSHRISRELIDASQALSEGMKVASSALERLGREMAAALRTANPK